jgi:hypothetical protein
MTDLARAAVLTEFGKPLEIQEFPILAPSRADSLLLSRRPPCAAPTCTIGKDTHRA